MKKSLLILFVGLLYGQSGIRSLNGSLVNSQRVAIDTTAGSFSVTTANGVHTIKIPYRITGSGGGSVGNADSLGGLPASYYLLKADSAKVSAGYGISVSQSSHTATVTADSSVLMTKGTNQVASGTKRFTSTNTYFGTTGANGVINLWDDANSQFLPISAGDNQFTFGNKDIYNAVWQGTSIDTAKTNAVSKITGTSPITATKNAKDYTLSLGAVDTSFTDAVSKIASGNTFLTATKISKDYRLTVDTARQGFWTTKGFLAKKDIDSVGTISRGIWNGTSIDTTYTNAVSKLTGGYGITATKNAKDYTVTVDSATLRSKYVPYSGANASVNLGAQTLTTTNTINSGDHNVTGFVKASASSRFAGGVSTYDSTSSIRAYRGSVSAGSVIPLAYTALSTTGAEKMFGGIGVVVGSNTNTIETGRFLRGTLNKAGTATTVFEVDSLLRFNIGGQALSSTSQLSVKNGLLSNAMLIQNSRGTTIATIDSNGSHGGTKYLRDSAAFSGTGQKIAIYIPGATKNDYYVATPGGVAGSGTAYTAPSTNDVLMVYPKTDSLIIYRPASGTSGLKVYYIRMN